MASNGVLIGILAYFLGIVFVGFLMRNKCKGAEDFLVGGRSFGVVFNSGTLTSCWLGGTVIVGVPGTFYACGIWDSTAMYGILVSFGAAGCLILAGLFYMRKLWQLKLLSLGDFYYRRYGNKAGLVATLLMGVTFTVWIALQVIAFAKVGQALVGYSLEMWIVVAMTVICTYTILGGLWAVCLTDIIQVGIVTLSLFILTPIAISMVGGFDTFIANVPAEKLEFLPADKTSIHAWLPWIGALSIIGLGSIASPDLMQRAFSAKTGKVARNSALVAAAITFVLFVVTVVLAFSCMSMIAKGSLSPHAVEQIAHDNELLVPVMFQDIMPVPMVATFLGACLSAVMSAAATANIALSGLISKNIIQDLFMPKIGSRQLMQLTRVIIVLVGLFAAYLSLKVDSALTLTNFGFDLILSCLFIPMALGIYWKKANGYGAVAAMIGGITVRVGLCGLINGFTMQSIAKPDTTWFYFTVAGPVVSLVCMLTVSLLTHKRAMRKRVVEEEQLEEWSESPVTVNVKNS